MTTLTTTETSEDSSPSHERAIKETQYLLSIPGLSESLKEGFKTPLDQCTQEIEW